MAFKLNLKFAKLLYLSDFSGQSIIHASIIYSKAPLIFSSFGKWKAQQIMASCVIVVNLMGMPKL